jgi:hypothetical protein
MNAETKPASASYAARLEVDYPEKLYRLTTLFRIIWIIPVAIILGLISNTGETVHLEIDYPDVEKDLKRGMPLVKWFLAIPHYIVLSILSVGAMFAVVIAWFAILFTGRYPRGLFDYVVGVSRWWLRVDAYAFLLVTDEYPPFSLK